MPLCSVDRSRRVSATGKRFRQDRQDGIVLSASIGKHLSQCCARLTVLAHPEATEFGHDALVPAGRSSRARSLPLPQQGGHQHRVAPPMRQFPHPLGRRVRGQDSVTANGKGAERKPHRASERLGIRCSITIAGGRHTPRKPTDHGLDQDFEDLAGEREARPQQRNGIGRDGPARRPQPNQRATAHCLDGGHLGSIRGLVEAFSVNQCPRAGPIRGSRIGGYRSEYCKLSPAGCLLARPAYDWIVL